MTLKNANNNKRLLTSSTARHGKYRKIEKKRRNTEGLVKTPWISAEKKGFD